MVEIPDRKWLPDTPFDLPKSLAMLMMRGSHSHGLYRPPDDPDSIDDIDLMGVCIPPASFYVGLRRWEGAESFKAEWDVVLYEFRKFARLLLKQNPNVLGMLWLEEECYLLLTSAGRRLIANRHLFRSRPRAYKSFCGYASAQLKRMTAGAFRGYMGEKRKRLVERHGYDTKNAAHLVRLLHMGIEYLRTGEVHVMRTWDRDMLLDIKSGGWSLSKVQRYATKQFTEISSAMDESVLPDEIDEDAVDRLLTDIVRTEMAW